MMSLTPFLSLSLALSLCVSSLLLVYISPLVSHFMSPLSVMCHFESLTPHAQYVQFTSSCLVIVSSCPSSTCVSSSFVTLMCIQVVFVIHFWSGCLLSSCHVHAMFPSFHVPGIHTPTPDFMFRVFHVYFWFSHFRLLFSFILVRLSPLFCSLPPAIINASLFVKNPFFCLWLSALLSPTHDLTA